MRPGTQRQEPLEVDDLPPGARRSNGSPGVLTFIITGVFFFTFPLISIAFGVSLTHQVNEADNFVFTALIAVGLLTPFEVGLIILSYLWRNSAVQHYAFWPALLLVSPQASWLTVIVPSTIYFFGMGLAASVAAGAIMHSTGTVDATPKSAAKVYSAGAAIICGISLGFLTLRKLCLIAETRRHN
ncbi:hypothetical protein DL96DRAFT_1814221 [Flagelloscypha sp. PMI_526]|nr:hypothetical protein DL96DRAFT_1814221 [Flagelloscypha sp. PMI_526]